MGKQQLSMSPDEFILEVLFKTGNTIVLRIKVIVNLTTCSLRLVYHQKKALNFLLKPTSTSHGWEGWISVEWGICLFGHASPTNSWMLNNFCNDEKKVQLSMNKYDAK